ncbi:MAG: ankyrin repeat domain-containing protein [Planctomycetota bacterium]
MHTLTIAACAAACALLAGCATSTRDPGAPATREVDLQLLRGIEQGRLDLVQAALEEGADPRARSEGLFFGQSALELAIDEAPTDVALLRCLLDAGADPEEVLHSFDERPLQLLARRGSPEAIELFLERGAELARGDESGETPLHVAAKAGNLAAVEFLIARGHPLECRGSNGRTPLLAACAQRRLDVVRALIARGADPLAVTRDGRSALVLAGWVNPELLRCLLEVGVDPERPGAQGERLVHLVPDAPSPEAAGRCLEVLRAHGVDFDALDSDGRTLFERLDLAARELQAAYRRDLARLEALRAACVAAQR